jgi:hypothetical protein
MRYYHQGAGLLGVFENAVAASGPEEYPALAIQARNDFSTAQRDDRTSKSSTDKIMNAPA